MTELEDVISQVEVVMRLRAAYRQAQEDMAYNRESINLERLVQEGVLARMTGAHSLDSFGAMKQAVGGGGKVTVGEKHGWSRTPTRWSRVMPWVVVFFGIWIILIILYRRWIG